MNVLLTLMLLSCMAFLFQANETDKEVLELVSICIMLKVKIFIDISILIFLFLKLREARADFHDKIALSQLDSSSEESNHRNKRATKKNNSKSVLRRC